MANNYTYFNQEETKTQDCPISLESVSLQSSDHPKKTILLKTGNKNYCFDTSTLWTWMTTGKQKHPMTNLKLEPHDIERIKFYKEALDKFPEMTMARVEQQVPELLESFFHGSKISRALANKWGEGEDFINYFADITDFKPYMFALPSDRSFRDNANRIMGLIADRKYWMMRQTSIADVPNKQEHYAISTNQGHYAIRHSFGEGYWSIKGSADPDPTFSGPSFMRVLKFLDLSLQDLVRGSIDSTGTSHLDLRS